MAEKIVNKVRGIMADGKYERSKDFPFDVIMKEVWKTARTDLKVDGEDAKLADIAVEYYDCDKKIQSLRREVDYIIFGDKHKGEKWKGEKWKE